MSIDKYIISECHVYTPFEIQEGYHNLDDNICVQSRNDLKIVVTDNLQNSTTFESYFFR